MSVLSKKLSDAEVAERLSDHPGWQTNSSIPAITKSYSFSDFNSGLKFLNAVGQLADQQDHHPDAHLTWGRLDLIFWTHTAQGITDLDFKMATLVDTVSSG